MTQDTRRWCRSSNSHFRPSSPGRSSMSDWRRALVIGCLFSLGAASAAIPKPKSAPADTIIVHGKVYTVNAQKPWAEALAIRGGKIVAVGSNREIQRFRGRGTRVIDARGHLVLPGFTDCHIHFLSGSLSLGQVNLEGARTVAEIQQRVKDYAASDRKSTRLNSSHRCISYAVFCLKKKKE